MHVSSKSSALFEYLMLLVHFPLVPRPGKPPRPIISLFPPGPLLPLLGIQVTQPPANSKNIPDGEADERGGADEAKDLFDAIPGIFGTVVGRVLGLSVADFGVTEVVDFCPADEFHGVGEGGALAVLGRAVGSDRGGLDLKCT